MRTFVAMLTASLVALSGCVRLAEPRIDYSGVDTHALIQVGDPQVYGRESLINDRREEMAFVHSRLEASAAPGFDMGTDLYRQIEAISAFSASLGLSFDTGIARQNRDTSDIVAKQHEVDLLQLDLQLAQLQRQLKTVEAGGDPGAAVADPAVAAAVAAPTAASTDAVATKLEAMLEKLRTRLATGGINASTLKSNPREQFRDIRAYRDELRGAYNEAQLDDVHDTEGRSLYKLRMPINILPGKETERYAIADFKLTVPEIEDEEYDELYYRWLGHLTMRLNSIGQDDRTDQLADRQLQFFGTASKLFMPVTFYVSGREPTGDSPFIDGVGNSSAGAYDPCLAVQAAVVAAATGCVPLIVATPYSIGKRLTSVFPRLDDVRMAIISHDLINNKHVFEDLPKEEKPRSADFMSLTVGKIQTPECRAHEYLPLQILSRFLAEVESCPALSTQTCSVDAMSEAVARKLDDDRCRALDAGQADTSQPAQKARKRSIALEIDRALLNPLSEETSKKDLTNLIRFASHRESSTKEISSKVEFPPWLEQRLSVTSSTSQEERTRRVLTYAVGEIVRRASRLPWEKRRLFMTQERLDEVLAQLGAMEKSLVAISKGLAARDGLASSTRARAEHLTQSLVDALRLRAALCRHPSPTEADKKAPNLPEGAKVAGDTAKQKSADADLCVFTSRIATASAPGDEIQRFRDLLKKDLDNPQIRVYAVAPRQLDQRVSTVSNAAQALQLAAAVQAADPLGGRSGSAAAGLSQQATSQVGAIERNPLVVGYARNRARTKDEDSNAAFGWVLGPRARVRAGWLRDQVQFDFVPTTFDVSADIAVPAWFPRIQLERRSTWASDWSATGKLLDGTPDTRTAQVDLPISRSDLDALTRKLAKEFGAAVPTARITRVEPQELNLCGDIVRLIVRGVDLWRGANLSINGVEPKTLAEIQPDMEGISASFDIAKLLAAIPVGAPAELAVSTQSGFDRYSVPISARVRANGNCELPPADPPLVVMPSEMHRCAAGVDLRLSLKEKISTNTLDILVDSKAFKASCGLQLVDGKKPASCDLWQARVTVDPKTRAGRDTLPIVAVLPGGPREITLKLVGDGKSCESAGAAVAPAKPTVSAVLTPAGGVLLACHDRETITLQGAKLGSIDGAKLLGVPATTVKPSAAGDVLTLEFNGLPAYAGTQAPGAKETALSLTSGGEVKASRNLAWSACSKE